MLCFKKILILLLFVMLAGFVHSQILVIDNSDTAAYKKQAKFDGNVSLSLEGDKQKQLLLDATNAARMQLQKYKELYIAALSYRFTYNGGQDFLNAGYMHLRWRHLYKNPWQPETYLQYQWDNALGMLHRFVTGMNVRHDFRQRDNIFSAATGLMYENEAWNYKAVDSSLIPKDPLTLNTSLLKSSSYLKWQTKIAANSNAFIAIFYQTPFNNLFQYYRIASNLRLELAFSKHLNWAMTCNTMYDSKPVVPIFKFYYSFSNSLGYTF